MADVTVTYKGATISEISASGTKTLKTAGKFCEDDITLQYVKPSGGGSYVGGTVAWNQICDNDFVNHYAKSGSPTVTKSGDTTTITVGNANSLIYLNSAYRSLFAQSGHKLLVFFNGYDATNKGSSNVKFSVLRSSSTGNTSDFAFTSDAFMIANTSNIYGFGLYITNNTSGNSISFKGVSVINLTTMFGSTIADYVYTLESGTAGAGIAWLKANGFFNSAYYPYDAGTLKSVETFAHPFKDSNGKIIGYFPQNFDLELRGIPKLDANNVLYYDGDEYDGNGTVTRKYGIVDLGTLDWKKTSGKNNLFNTRLSLSTAAYGGSSDAVCKAVCAKYVSAPITNTYTNEADKTVSFTATGYCYIEDSAYTDATAFETAMSGVYLVYELATPTTETV